MDQLSSTLRKESIKVVTTTLSMDRYSLRKRCDPGLEQGAFSC